VATVREGSLFAKRSKKWLALLVLLTCLQVTLSIVETRAQVECSIASLDYPSEVIGRRSFTLKVTVDYSFPYRTYSLRVVVLEGGYRADPLGGAVLGSSTPAEVSGAGYRTLSIQLTAPSASKEWFLTAYACYKGPEHAEWYFLGSKGGYKSFTVLVYTRCRVWLKTSPSGVARYAKMLGEGEYNADTTVTLKIDKTVVGAPGTRYVFLCWIVDGVRYDLEAPTIRMDRREITATAEFKVQHELTVRSELGDPQGSGWYDEGSVATFSVTSPANLGIHVFERWTGDSSSTSPQSTVLMNSPKTVTAIWRINYSVLLTILLGIAGALALAVVLRTYSKKGKVVVPTTPVEGPRPEPSPEDISAKTVPETPTAVKEIKEVPPPKVIPIEKTASELDEKVYNYIVEHEGTIALSQAAKDLGISLSDLSAAIERLKGQGRLT